MELTPLCLHHTSTIICVNSLVASMSQPTYQFIEGLVMDWIVNNSLYVRFQPGN